MSAPGNVADPAGPAPAKRARRWGWKIKLATVVTSVLAALLVIEIVLRLRGAAYRTFLQPDEVLGWSLHPGAVGWSRGEGSAYVTINRWGMHDRELPKEKPPGTFRIAVLGDSFVEAKQVAMESSFCSCLQRELAARRAFGGANVEVLNFGVSAYGTAQELLMLRHRAWDFSPDLILLAFFTGNDLSDNSKALNPEPAPFFVFAGDQLVLDNSFRESEIYRDGTTTAARLSAWLADHSRIGQILDRRRVNQHFAQTRAKAKAITEQLGVDEGFNQWLYRAPQHPQWAEAWKVTEGILVMLRDEVAAHKTRLAVVTLSTSEQVHPDPRVRRETAKACGTEDLFYPDRRLKAFLEKEGVAVFNLAPPMQRYAEEQKVFLHGFESSASLGSGHWNEAGHRLAAELTAAWLCSDAVLGPGEPAPAGRR